MESTQQAKIRRLQDMLIIAGDAVIAFSAWSLVKAALFFVFADSDKWNRMFSSVDESLLVYVLIAVGVMVCIDLAIRAYVGMSARSEGNGKKKSPFYLVVAALAAVVNVFSAFATALGSSSYTLSSFDTVVTIAVEATAFVALATVIYCSVRLRSLDKATG